MNLTSRLPAKVLIFLSLAFLLSTGECFAASAGEWRKLRENARESAKANNYDAALEQYKAAFEEASEAFKGTDMRFLDTVGEAAQFHVQFRRYDEAIEMYEAALDRMQTVKGLEAPYKVAFQIAIGKAHMYAKRLDDAALSFREAVDYVENRPGSESNPQLGEALEGLAGVYIERKLPDEALRLLKRAVKAASYAPSGMRSTETSILNTTGILHLSQSNYVDAEKAFRDALKSVGRERATGEMNFIKANTSNIERNLAQAYRGQREYAKAEQALFRSIAITEKLSGSAMATAQSLAVLAAVHFEQNDAGLDNLFARLTSKKADKKNFLPYVEVIARQYSIRDQARTEALLDKAIAAAPQHAAELKALRERLAAEPKPSLSATPPEQG
ncbi:MAG TPA: tetratricopeptide repeat protein [Verrucomicrobiae bacterium]